MMHCHCDIDIIQGKDAEIDRLTNAIRVARQFLITGGPESIAECDGGAWDAAETLHAALGRTIDP